MKRSELNKIISDAIQFVEKREIPLPPFAYWGPEEWRQAKEEDRELVDNMLGWDITDFGSGDFEKSVLLFLPSETEISIRRKNIQSRMQRSFFL